MPDTMIDRLAHTLWGQSPDKPVIHNPHGLDKPDLSRFRTDARAVLIIMRQPNEAMTRAGADSLDYDANGGLLGGSEEAVHNAFTLMIDAALAEEG